MTIQEYIDNIARRYASGITTEHSFRGDLQSLIEALASDVMATNEPTRIDCGAPDYVLTRKNIPIGYIEAKDIGVDLSGKTFKEQYDRYREALDNLAFTDYLEFRFFVSGQPQGAPLSIAEIQGARVVPLTNNFDAFATRIKEFCARSTVTIKGSQRLAEMMADKAKILAYTIREALTSDEQSDENTELRQQMAAFKEILIHDIDAKQFADVYAQTIVYGMFAARLHDKNLDTFSRQEAAVLIPKTNPFLRKLFHHIAGYDLDRRIDWIVDDLADLFRATDVRSVLKNYGKTRASEDPIMHFYEKFLAEYDPKLRKARGVYYTPEPVVDFIVRAVDDILKTEFGLPAGLADTSKVKVKVPTTVKDARTASGYREEEKEFHKVQILDPATGTGTFLAQVIKQIYKKFENQRGAWPTYAENDLIPRLNGFELLMASYAMAHLKLDLLLEDTNYNRESAKRFQIYLTNALEEHHPDTGTLWATWLSTEANEANHIKRDTPVMVVIGNPPYSVSSTNKAEWIEKLLGDYKRDLNERNIQPLSDDYIKFIRFGQYFVQKNSSGVLAFISNNSFVEGLIHRQMRKALSEAFDKIYILDLHGSSKKREVAPDGSADENVFDIMQGVSINIFVKNPNKDRNSDCRVFYTDVFGKRQSKYGYLQNQSIGNIAWKDIVPAEPSYFYKGNDFVELDNKKKVFALNDLFSLNSSGVQTKRDSLFVDLNKDALIERMHFLLEQEYDSSFAEKYNISDSSSYNLLEKISNSKFKESYLRRYDYRPFDTRHVYYDTTLLGRPFYKVIRHLMDETNIGLITTRANRGLSAGYNFITTRINDLHLLDTAADAMFVCPLYLYPNANQPTLDGRPERVPNLNMEIVDKIAAGIGHTFIAECAMRNAESRRRPRNLHRLIFSIIFMRFCTVRTTGSGIRNF